jgi:hypothetical protein
MQTTIDVDESRLNFPLRPLYAGRLSSLDVTILGVPKNVTALAIYVGRVDAEQPFMVACEPAAGGCGTWKCYLSPWCFPAVANGLKYNVMGTREGNVSKWLGCGQLTIAETPAGATPVPPPIVPDDTYIRNPVTGLYHKVTASVDEAGNLTMVLDSEGVER